MFKDVIEVIKDNKKQREEGKFIGIPWLSLPKLSSVIPGIQKRRYIICTAASKVGKTQITNFLYVYQPLKFKMLNPEKKLKIFYFSLEISKHELLLGVIANRLYEEYNITVSPENLSSYFKDFVVSDDLVGKIESLKEYYKLFEETVVVYDNIRNPTGIYKTVREYAKANGKFYFKGSEVNPESTLYDNYKPNDPDADVIVIVDNYNLIVSESGQTKRESIENFSKNYCLKMRDNLGMTVVGVQQQSGEAEKQQFTFKGDSIVEKLRPTKDGLSESRTTGNDVDLLIGLFAPVKYGIPTYPESNGYDINILRDNYRELSIILNRRGGGSINLDLFFNGAVGDFKEMPSPKEFDYVKFKEWKKSLTNK